jgi:hypothetical protein
MVVGGRRTVDGSWWTQLNVEYFKALLDIIIKPSSLSTITLNQHAQPTCSISHKSLSIIGRLVMKFEVVKDRVVKMSTTHQSCVYDKRTLLDMKEWGYSFRLDGEAWDPSKDKEREDESQCLV